MSLNHHMHSRNIYKDNPPDFVQLSKTYPSFKPYVKVNKAGKGHVNFRNPAAVRELAKCLLHKDFGYTVDLPDDRLSPTIPCRLNYMLWVQDLLDAIIAEKSDEKLRIIDIGTGSSCVYPLLGVFINSDMNFTATEIDEINFEYAKRNVDQNNLTNCIKVVKVDSAIKTLLRHLVEDNTDAYKCCICNPPFFEDKETHKANGKMNSSCSASNVEAITTGGDLEFAERIYNESLVLKDSLVWYTIMFGKKSSFVTFKKRFVGNRTVLSTTYEFCQGSTMRWGLAWSHTPESIDASKIPLSPFQSFNKTKKLSKPISFYIPSQTFDDGKDLLLNILKDLSIRAKVIRCCDRSAHIGAAAFEETWVGGRQRARKRKHNGNTTVVEDNSIDGALKSNNPIFEFHIELCLRFAGQILASFSTQNHTHKESMNGLVVHLRRIFSHS